MAIAALNVNELTTTALVVPPVNLTNTWNNGFDFLAHTKNIQSEITKLVPTLEVGKRYKFGYEVFDYVSCTLRLRVGNSKLGPVSSANGFYFFEATIDSEEDKKITFIADGIVKVRHPSYQEKIFTTTPLPFSDRALFEDKSWTYSYSFHRDSWVSFMSFIPNYYIHTQNHFYSVVAGVNSIWKHNLVGSFLNYYGKQYPWIVEMVSLASPLENRMTESIKIQTTARKWDAALQQYSNAPHITFNKITAYNVSQSTGELLMKVKQTQTAASWYLNQIKNIAGEILITQVDKDWNLNDLRDHVTDYSKPLFSSSWLDTQLVYPIDKVENDAVIDHLKPWGQLQNFKDKFLIVRLKFDNFTNVNLTLNYSIQTEPSTVR